MGTLPFDIAGFHDHYGPVVRIGPKEVSFTDERAWGPIYGKHDFSQLERDPLELRHP